MGLMSKLRQCIRMAKRKGAAKDEFASPLSVEELKELTGQLLYLKSEMFPQLNGWFYLEDTYYDAKTHHQNFVFTFPAGEIVLDEIDLHSFCGSVRAYRTSAGGSNG